MRVFKQLLSSRFKILHIALVALILVAVGVAYYNVSIPLHPSPPGTSKIQSVDALYRSYRQGNFQDAIPQAEAYLKSNGESAEIRNILVACYVQLGEKEKALREAEAALKLRPKNPDALYRAGQLAADLGRDGAAIRYLRQAIKVRPEAAQYHSQLAEVYASAKSYGKAVDEWETVLELLPSKAPYRAAVYRKMGDIYTAQGNAARAKRAYANARSADRASPRPASESKAGR